MRRKDGGSSETMRFWSRLAFATAIAVLVAGTYVSLGGASFAERAPTKIASAAKSAVTLKTEPARKTDSAAADQYRPPSVSPAGKASVSSAGTARPKSGAFTPPATSPTSLPFTGFSLLSTLLISIGLVIAGMTLRRRATLRSR